MEVLFYYNDNSGVGFRKRTQQKWCMLTSRYILRVVLYKGLMIG
jgi:hypothetical protein